MKLHSATLVLALSSALASTAAAGQQILAPAGPSSPIQISDLDIDYETKYSILLDAKDGVANCGGSKRMGLASLKPALVSYIKAKSGLGPFFGGMGDEAIVQTTFVTSTTEHHVDHHQPDRDGVRHPVNDNDHVAFIPIKASEGAYFDIEDSCIPLHEGRAVRFNGRRPHRTVLRNGGSVSLLGPFDLKTMKNVGTIGTCAPTPAPVPSPHYHWDLPGTHDESSCQPKGKECNGFPYYRVLSGTDLSLSGGSGTWEQFLEATPDNCILAPIGSQDELDELIAEVGAIVGSSRISGWIGVYKPAVDYTQGQGSYADWFNLDGTPAAAVCDGNNWFPSVQPSGNERQLFVGFNLGTQSGLLDRASAGGVGSHAFYKCCAPVVTFPTSSCDDA